MPRRTPDSTTAVLAKHPAPEPAGKPSNYQKCSQPVAVPLDDIPDRPIHSAHHTGSLPSVDLATGEPAYTVNTIDAETGESWSMTADDALAAWTELALLGGIELMD